NPEWLVGRSGWLGGYLVWRASEGCSKQVAVLQWGFGITKRSICRAEGLQIRAEPWKGKVAVGCYS
ncbi:18132_t:CDS:2, partial [Gigaspora rosea]